MPYLATAVRKQRSVVDPMAAGRLHSIETMGTVDGPGLRYVIFLNGCPLRCQYCHNPETQGSPSGDSITATEAIDDVLRYKSFLRSGGLTISGGEPLMQPDFVRAAFSLAKKEGIHTALDTSGFLGRNADDELLENTDLVLLDIKGGEPETYKRTTGVDIKPTLDFARRLDAMRIPIWLRFVFVPGLTDSDDNIEYIAAFAATLGNIRRIQILPFHKMGEHKYSACGKSYQLANTPTPKPHQLQRARDIFKKYALKAE